jgi:hypothetical protein
MILWTKAHTCFSFLNEKDWHQVVDNRALVLLYYIHKMVLGDNHLGEKSILFRVFG